MPKPLTQSVQRGCLFSDEAIAWLSARGIPFVERDIGRDPGALRDLERLDTIVTPTILVGDEVIYGFDVDRLTGLLEGRDATGVSRDATAAARTPAAHGDGSSHWE